MSEAEGQEGGAAQAPRSVALLVTCLIDLFRPSAAFAAVQLLEDAGYSVAVPEQSCCGQPNFNGGDRVGARRMARQMIAALEGYEYVVVPSGSCAAMVSRHYPALFEEGSAEYVRAVALAERTWELTAFLCDVAGVAATGARFDGNLVLHDACSALRELGVREQPRALLAGLQGCRLHEPENADVCCGFGGLFCVKYAGISDRMAQKKITAITAAAGPGDALVSTDLGCLMHLEGKLRRDGASLQVWHIAEVLAGTTKGEPG